VHNESVFKLAQLSDLIFELVSSETLVIEHFALLASIVAEVSMTEVCEANDCEEQNQVRVVELALVLKWIITKLVAVGFVVNSWLVFQVMGTCIPGPVMDIAARN